MFRSFFKRARSSGRQARKIGSRKQFRPRVESLEDRRVLAAIMVDTFADVVANDGQTSLREAIAQAAAHPGTDKIKVPTGTYTLALGQLTINDSHKVRIESVGGPATIDGNSATRVFEVTAVSRVEMEGLVIAHGVAADNGGGILNAGDLKIKGGAVSSNSAGRDGGGIYNQGTATIENSDLNANQALAFGAGIYSSHVLTVKDSAITSNVLTGEGEPFVNGGGGIYVLGQATIAHSVVSGNSASFGNGAGIAVDFEAVVTVRDTDVSDNQVFFGNGGGMYSAGNLNVEWSTINGNSAFGNGLGGGIYNIGPQLTIVDCTLSDNFSESSGGAIANQGLSVTIKRSTINDNFVWGSAAGAYNEGTMTIDDTTMSDNTSLGSGGAISNSGTLVLTRSAIRNSTGFLGGGMVNGGTATIDHSVISDNSATLSGGGMINIGSLLVTHSTISGNSANAEFGGGIFNILRDATIIASTISDNFAAVGGGGIYNTLNASVDVTSSTFYNNSSGFLGGAIGNSDSGKMNLTNSTFYGNTTGFAGGAIVNFGAVGTIVSCTVSGNSSDSEGGGIWTSNFDILQIRNTIVAGNTAPTGPDVRGFFTSLGHNLIGIGDGSTGFGATGDIVGTAEDPIDALLGPLQDNGGPTWTMELLFGSLAIDAGDPDLDGTTDQRGVLRPQGDGVDIGAFELED